MYFVVSIVVIVNNLKFALLVISMSKHVGKVRWTHRAYFCGNRNTSIWKCVCERRMRENHYASKHSLLPPWNTHTHIQSGKLMNSTCACATTLAQKMEALKEKHRYFMQFSLKDDCVHVSTVLSAFVIFSFLFACSIFLGEWFFSFTSDAWSSTSTFVHLLYYFNMLAALCYHCFFCS